MGAIHYSYFVAHRPDVGAALHELREREFRAGRYYPVMFCAPGPIGPDAPAPGPQHPTIRAALRASGANGTRSILDLDRVAAMPQLGAVAPLPDDVLLELYGTTRPTRELIEQGADSEYIERGQGIYVVVYKDDRPDELYFAGYSYD
jgi:hypothetical protein